jgi:LPPG:FO 2-phospho-L-lactate transferase
MRAALRAARVPVIAVSPLIGGKAVKGPTAKIMRELGVAATIDAVAAHYGPLVDAYVIDHADAAAAAALGIEFAVTNTSMRTLDDRERVAASALELAQSMRARRVLQTDRRVS